MSSLISQINAVILMNIKSLPQRLWMSLAALVAVAVVVGVLLAFLAMSHGFRATVQNSGSEDVALILRSGSQAELNSTLLRDQVAMIENGPGITKDADGPITSGELYVIVDGRSKDTNLKVNLPLRGIGPHGITVRKNVEIVEGRMFESGKNELVVGVAALDEISGFELGAQVKLSNNVWTVVGIFDAGPSVFSSEIWTDARVIQSQFNRGSSVQVVRAQLENQAALEELKTYLNDPVKNLNVDVFTEAQFYKEQSASMSDFLFYLGWPLSIIMAMGALAGALNTMYTSVAQRSREIATLRAIGFSGFSAFVGTLIESLVLSVIGGLLGAVFAFLLFDNFTTSTLGSNFTQVVFNFQLDGDAFVQGVVLALFIGLIGGTFPAYKAARMPVVVAFKSTP